MNEEQISDIWMLFKEYLDKKHTTLAAEKFIDVLADYGVTDETFTNILGVDSVLDDAISYYLDLGNEDTFAEEWED